LKFLHFLVAEVAASGLERQSLRLQSRFESVTSLPTFFFSHARQDREMPGNYLIKFFEDLELKLAQWTGVNLKEKRLGTIDSRLQQGDNWDQKLSQALSENRSFLAILTPLYFNRPSCGKELAVFLLRSPQLSLDPNGALQGATNILTIRWLPESAYSVNTDKDAVIPAILRLIQDTPGDDGGDSDRTRAIARYQKKGMEKCVQHEPEYSELLDLFAERIRALSDLSPAANVTFATAVDAFKYDWHQHFAGPNGPAPSGPAGPVAPAAVPQPLSSVVVFHITRRQLTTAPSSAAFADKFVVESLAATQAPVDAQFAGLLTDIRAAAIGEGMAVFHVVSDPPVPVASPKFLDHLATLSAAKILTAVVIDPDIWPNGEANAVVEEVVSSSNWTGLVLLPAFGPPPAGVDLTKRQLPPRIVALPQDSAARIAHLRRAIVDLRGRVLSASIENSPSAERIPFLSGVGGVKT
jgi:hypothetical protein